MQADPEAAAMTVHGARGGQEGDPHPSPPDPDGGRLVTVRTLLIADGLRPTSYGLVRTGGRLMRGLTS